jgi:prepilin-type N-terminal cleavage/methylation domain-containing protein
MFQNSCLFYCPGGISSGMKICMPKVEVPEAAGCTKARGFTMVEVILVLAIIAVLTTVIIARNNSSASRARLYGQADLLKSQLRYAQARSMNSDRVWGMTALNNNLSLFESGNTANTVFLPGENTKIIAYGGNHLSGLAVSDFTLSFDDHGRPCSDASGTDLLTAALRINLSDALSGASVDIDVTPNSGFIQ